MEEEIICSCQHWTQREALKDSGPDKSDPRQNAIANTSGRAKHSAFVSHLKVRNKSEGIKLSEGSTQAGSQLQILWSPNHWMTQSNLPFQSRPNAGKGVADSDPLWAYDLLVLSLSSFLLFSPLHPPTLPAGQQKGWRVVSLLLKSGCQRLWLFHSPVIVEHLTLLIINSMLC